MKSVQLIILIVSAQLGLSAAIGYAQPPNQRRPWQQPFSNQNLAGPGRNVNRPGTDRNAWNPAERVARRNDYGAADDGRTGNRQLGSDAEQPWWQTDAEATADVTPAANARLSGSQGELIRSSQIVAMIGTEPILAGDLLGRINEGLQRFAGQIPESELEKKRHELVEQMLPSAIEAKVVYMDFLRNIQAEQLEAIRGNIYQAFDEKQLPDLVKRAKVKDVAELELKLREVGSSLDKSRRAFFEQVAAREMIRKNGDVTRNISPNELRRYYRKNLQDFEIQAKAKWEHLMSRCPSTEPDAKKSIAYRKIAHMGNAIIGGAPLAVVAKRDSDGFTAEEGGMHDWTTKGSLVSTVLDNAIFSLPIGQLSNILADDNGFHIIRVTERQEAGYRPFTEVQQEIKENILAAEREEKVTGYIEKLKAETYVWNYFDTAVAKRESDRNKAIR